MLCTLFVSAELDDIKLRLLLCAALRYSYNYVMTSVTLYRFIENSAIKNDVKKALLKESSWQRTLCLCELHAGQREHETQC